ncbi:glycosyl hydrolase family 18 protein [Bacillus taeanensis]|uniref:Glycoside hydrolase n=1 Tax=Bacillus taeanensis TaxID=273032 RepID=A0A366XNX2_9BACI|nr:glycosyl hydrolase family 18 protein [Bacillus taeanensis]RBW67607.1 glycoside hydrolase [Bacillus taeanensis]
MELFQRHKLIEKDGTQTIILYLNPLITEFADELGLLDKKKSKRFEEAVKTYVKNNFPTVKKGMIKVMFGTMVFTTISLGETSTPQAEAADFNMSYLFFGTTTSQIQFVDRTEGSLQVAAPSYFDINPDGTLKLSNQFSTRFIAEMKAKNVKVVPFLSNHWNRDLGRAALENREQLANQIAQTIEQYNLGGVNVDIENVTEADRDAYTDLVRLLREKLPPEKEVSVAVAANPYGWKTGWHGSYDYKNLAEYADYLMIMAYDESYESGPAGPVASYGWVEKSITYALNQNVPSEKIVLGLPFFGRYWNEQESYGGRGIAQYRVDELVQQFNGTVTYDSKTASAKAAFTVNAEDPTAYVYGRALTPGNYTVWYENAQSIQAKMDLVHKYNLKGTGSWALGQEDPAIWSHYEQWLQGEPFKDTLTHWARYDARAMHEKGWMKGMEQDLFAPDQTLTRAQAAAIIARALNLQPTGNQSASFQDTANHWAKSDIELVADYGIIIGTETGKFSPDAPITREQIAVILDRVISGTTAQAAQTSSFQDVSADRWSYQSIARMDSLGVVKGMGDQKFQPLDKVTRGQMAALMNRASVHFPGSS